MAGVHGKLPNGLIGLTKVGRESEYLGTPMTELCKQQSVAAASDDKSLQESVKSVDELGTRTGTMER